MTAWTPDWPAPTKDEVRAAGFSGDVTRFPLTWAGYVRRCQMNGVDPLKPPNNAWFYAPNACVQEQLNAAYEEAKEARG